MPPPITPLKRIGILGGSSDQATADYYARLNQAINRRAGGHNTAELLINSMNFALSAQCVREERWEELATYLTGRAVALERAGADLLICVSNTLHKLAPAFTAPLTIPFLHIADPTARAIRGQGLRKIALLGTRPVMSGTHLRARYAELFEIDTLVPDAQDQHFIDQTIFDELCKGVFLDSTKCRYLDIMAKLAARGAQGVILGCTEIPLLVSQADRPDLPMFDTTGLHVQEAADFALGGVLHTSATP